MSAIETRRDLYPIDATGTPQEIATERIAYTRRRVSEELLRRRHAALSSDRTDTVVAYINHGRWVADCAKCPGAERVDPDDDFFACLSCGVVSDTTFPTAKERDAIEKALCLRSLDVTRNWLPGESVESLTTETAERGSA